MSPRGLESVCIMTFNTQQLIGAATYPFAFTSNPDGHNLLVSVSPVKFLKQPLVIYQRANPRAAEISLSGFTLRNLFILSFKHFLNI